MAGIIIGGIVQIPGNGLHGNWTRQLCGADTAQAGAAIDLLMGRTGGPLADLAPLARQYRGAERASIAFNPFEVRGPLRGDCVLEAETEAYRGPAGEVAAWNENILAAIPGTSARVPEAECAKRKDDGIRLDVAIDAHNVIHAGFRFRRA